MSTEPYFEINPDPETAKRIRKEREKSRELKRTPWWKNQLHKGTCHYCSQQFPPGQLSMDHIVPLARGGKSTKGNIVPSCVECNRKKNLETPAETALRMLSE
ncbi:MAG: HNH endonuclease [Nitrospirota bacterium]|nr:HNH endonuclease [Nitrospirota bacterium]